MYISAINGNDRGGSGPRGVSAPYGYGAVRQNAARYYNTQSIPGAAAVPYGGVTAPYMKKTARIYLLVSLFTVVFGHIYEHYSFGVYSRAMFWAFLIPLFAGAALFRVLSLMKMKFMPDRDSLMYYHWGIAAFTVGSLFKGALDIYGTSNSIVNVYWVAGGALIAFGIYKYFMKLTWRK